MRYSNLFPKTQRSAPAEYDLESAQLLYRAGFVDQLMAGVFSLLPLGWRTFEKIKQVIREEMNAIGGQELLMPTLQPKELWDKTGRWESLTKGDIMYHLRDRSDRPIGLSLTHEETALDLIRKRSSSYKDYPISIYHFSTKFREEARPRGGLLRVREFVMKDLYSAHTTEEDFEQYYEVVKSAYAKIFKRLGLDVRVVEASGGVFTPNHSHEFQVFTEVGEDTIYYCEKCDFAQNKEIAEVQEGDKCPKCGGRILVSKAVEVGNIFPFGTKYSKDIGVAFTDQDGQEKAPYFGSYGIGLGRVLATIAEVSRDEKGLIWPESVAPFEVHLVGLDLNDVKVRDEVEMLYRKLQEKSVEVLFDDRDIRAGEKFADADLLGIPLRVVISAKSGAGGGVEVKGRSKEDSEIVSVDQLLSQVA